MPGFNPNEPRDKSGQWTAVPGYVQEKITSNTPGEDEKTIQDYVDGKTRKFPNNHIPETEQQLEEKVAQVIPPEAKAAVEKYTYDSGEINYELRNGSGLEPANRPTVTALDKFMSEAPKTQTTVYRGMYDQTGSLFDKFRKLQPGSVFSDNGYTSATLSKTIWGDFGTVSGANGYVPPSFFLRIKSKTGVPINAVSQHNGEHEVLFKRGTSFKVVNNKEFAGRDQYGTPRKALLIDLEEI